MPENQNQVNQVVQGIADAATSGVQSTSVDGVSVQKMSMSDRLAALNQLKKEQMTDVYQALGFFKTRIK